MGDSKCDASLGFVGLYTVDEDAQLPLGIGHKNTRYLIAQINFNDGYALGFHQLGHVADGIDPQCQTTAFRLGGPFAHLNGFPNISRFGTSISRRQVLFCIQIQEGFQIGIFSEQFGGFSQGGGVLHEIGMRAKQDSQRVFLFSRGGLFF